MSRHLLFLSFLLLACQIDESAEYHPVTIRVVAESLPAGDRVYIAGNLPDLGSWNPRRVALEPAEDGAWERTFSFQAGTHLEFKFTRGSWATEAVDPDGLERQNYRLDVLRDTIVTIEALQWRDKARGRTLLSAERMANKAGGIEFTERWKFRSGDNQAWADPEYDDSEWELVVPLLRAEDLPAGGWKGIGWFRLPVMVDSSLWGVPLSIFVEQAGASEIYLNGRRLFALGAVGTSTEGEVPYVDRVPRVILFDRQGEQLIAVRYSNFSWEDFHGFNAGAGFLVSLGEADPAIADHAGDVRVLTTFQMVAMTLAAVLALLHVLLFLFDSREKTNLYLAILTGAIAVINFINFQVVFETSGMARLELARLAVIPSVVIPVFGMLSGYAFTRVRIPWQFYVVCAAAAGASIWNFVEPGESAGIATGIVLALATLEVVRSVVVALARRRREPFLDKEGSWIVGLGGLVFLVAVVYQVLVNFDLLALFIPFPPYYIGFLVFAMSMSIHLAYSSARTKKELQIQLVQVGELSEKALEQERRAREEEISRRVLEADNARKTEELEQARRLQLSMLPKTLPEIASLEIAVYMSTATEVGGDYYDFRMDDGGSLTIAVGDATGHGTRAGIMVTLIKSLFNTLGHSFYIPDFFGHCTEFIRRMHMENLYMGLLLARIRNGKMIASAAGMPPVYIYRADRREVEEIVIKGMPLGGPGNFPYQQVNTELKTRDTVLLMSDGFPELFNSEREMLDYPRAKQLFGELAERSSQEIIDRLAEEAEKWRGEAPQNDDITFVVVKVR
jgi:serine phosphatase RsbU (regulator of sigma subunit)